MHKSFPFIPMYFLPTDHMSMNSKLLALGTSVFHHRGTTNELLPGTILGSSSKADCVAIQCDRYGDSQLVMSLEPKPGQVYFCTCRIFGTHYISFLLIVRAVVPFAPQAKRPPWQGLWAAATINSVGMRSLEWRRPFLHANPLGHRVPTYLPKGCALHWVCNKT